MDFCENKGSVLVEVNTWVENAVVVAMAEEALASDNNIERDYWMGGVKTGNVWSWQSGENMEFTNWWGGDPDGEGQGALREAPSNTDAVQTEFCCKGRGARRPHSVPPLCTKSPNLEAYVPV